MRATTGTGLAAIAVLALSLLAAPRVAEARDYPWCVFYDSSTYNCGFTSYAQCMQTAQGGQGFCRPNPFAEPQRRRQSR